MNKHSKKEKAKSIKPSKQIIDDDDDSNEESREELSDRLDQEIHQDIIDRWERDFPNDDRNRD